MRRSAGTPNDRYTIWPLEANMWLAKNILVGLLLVCLTFSTFDSCEARDKENQPDYSRKLSERRQAITALRDYLRSKRHGDDLAIETEKHLESLDQKKEVDGRSELKTVTRKREVGEAIEEPVEDDQQGYWDVRVQEATPISDVILAYPEEQTINEDSEALPIDESDDAVSFDDHATIVEDEDEEVVSPTSNFQTNFENSSPSELHDAHAEPLEKYHVTPNAESHKERKNSGPPKRHVLGHLLSSAAGMSAASAFLQNAGTLSDLTCESEALAHGHVHNFGIIVHEILCELRKMWHHLQFSASNIQKELSVGPLTSDSPVGFLEQAPLIFQAISNDPQQLSVIPEIAKESIPFTEIKGNYHRLKSAFRKLMPYIRVFCGDFKHHFNGEHEGDHLIEHVGLTPVEHQELNVLDELLSAPSGHEVLGGGYGHVRKSISKYLRRLKDMSHAMQSAHDGFHASGLPELFKSGFNGVDFDSFSNSFASAVQNVPYLKSFLPNGEDASAVASSSASSSASSLGGSSANSFAGSSASVNLPARRIPFTTIAIPEYVSTKPTLSSWSAANSHSEADGYVDPTQVLHYGPVQFPRILTTLIAPIHRATSHSSASSSASAEADSARHRYFSNGYGLGNAFDPIGREYVRRPTVSSVESSSSSWSSASSSDNDASDPRIHLYAVPVHESAVPSGETSSSSWSSASYSDDDPRVHLFDVPLGDGPVSTVESSSSSWSSVSSSDHDASDPRIQLYTVPVHESVVPSVESSSSSWSPASSSDALSDSRLLFDVPLGDGPVSSVESSSSSWSSASSNSDNAFDHEQEPPASTVETSSTSWTKVTTDCESPSPEPYSEVETSASSSASATANIAEVHEMYEDPETPSKVAVARTRAWARARSRASSNAHVNEGAPLVIVDPTVSTLREHELAGSNVPIDEYLTPDVIVPVEPEIEKVHISRPPVILEPIPIVETVGGSASSSSSAFASASDDGYANAEASSNSHALSRLGNKFVDTIHYHPQLVAALVPKVSRIATTFAPIRATASSSSSASAIADSNQYRGLDLNIDHKLFESNHHRPSPHATHKPIAPTAFYPAYSTSGPRRLSKPLIIPRHKIARALNSGVLSPGDIIVVALDNQSAAYGRVEDYDSPIIFNLLRPRISSKVIQSGGTIWNLIPNDLHDAECENEFYDAFGILR